MKLIFYSVDNSCEYERHSFDNDGYDDVLEKIKKLGDDEYRIYDLSNQMELFEFMEDYNDEYLDGGWWCIAFNE